MTIFKTYEPGTEVNEPVAIKLLSQVKQRAEKLGTNFMQDSLFLSEKDVVIHVSTQRIKSGNSVDKIQMLNSGPMFPLTKAYSPFNNYSAEINSSTAKTFNYKNNILLNKNYNPTKAYILRVANLCVRRKIPQAFIAVVQKALPSRSYKIKGMPSYFVLGGIAIEITSCKLLDVEYLFNDAGDVEDFYMLYQLPQPTGLDPDSGEGQFGITRIRPFFVIFKFSEFADDALPAELTALDSAAYFGKKWFGVNGATPKIIEETPSTAFRSKYLFFRYYDGLNSQKTIPQWIPQFGLPYLYMEGVKTIPVSTIFYDIVVEQKSILKLRNGQIVSEDYDIPYIEISGERLDGVYEVTNITDGAYMKSFYEGREVLLYKDIVKEDTAADLIPLGSSFDGGMGTWGLSYGGAEMAEDDPNILSGLGFGGRLFYRYFRYNDGVELRNGVELYNTENEADTKIFLGNFDKSLANDYQPIFSADDGVLVPYKFFKPGLLTFNITLRSYIVPRISNTFYEKAALLPATLDTLPVDELLLFGESGSFCSIGEEKTRFLLYYIPSSYIRLRVRNIKNLIIGLDKNNAENKLLSIENIINQIISNKATLSIPEEIEFYDTMLSALDDFITLYEECIENEDFSPLTEEVRLIYDMTISVFIDDFKTNKILDQITEAEHVLVPEVLGINREAFGIKTPTFGGGGDGGGGDGGGGGGPVL